MRISEDFAIILNDIVGNDSQGKAEIKTGISKSYWVYLLKGKVPRPEALEKIIDGYKPSQAVISALYTTAGYEIPSKYTEAEQKEPEATMRDFFYAMRGGGPKTKETDARARKIFEKILAEEALEHINGEPEL